MSQFHLRPVADNTPSPSPTASTSSPDRASPHKVSPITATPSQQHPHYANGRPRRPLSPSSLRDLDLSRTSDMAQRKYPAPPTGHELMAMFPPAPPETSPETRGGPTSGFFQRQERAFFAQAGREIVRVKVEIDLPSHPEMDGTHGKPRPPRDMNGPRSWPPLPQHPAPNGSVPHLSPVHSASTPSLPHPTTRPAQRVSVPAAPPAPLYPMNAHSPSSQHPPNLHSSPIHQPGMGLRTPPQESIPSGPPGPKTEFQPEEYDPDEAWRHPIPYHQRRRAGKHTRRVVVRS